MTWLVTFGILWDMTRFTTSHDMFTSSHVSMCNASCVLTIHHVHWVMSLVTFGIWRDITRFMTSYVESYVMRHVCIDNGSYVSSHVTYDIQISTWHDSFLLNSVLLNSAFTCVSHVTYDIQISAPHDSFCTHQRDIIRFESAGQSEIVISCGVNFFFWDKETWTMSHVWMRHVDRVVCVTCNASCVPIMHM